MKKKFMSALLFGALLAAPASMFVSCKDYDDDISELRGDITTNATDLTSLVTEKMKNLNAEVEALKSQSEVLKTAYEAADRNLEQAVKTATNDAKGYADIQAAEAQKAAIASAQTLVDNAVASLQASLVKANAIIESQGSSIESLLSDAKNMQSSIDKANALIEAQSKQVESLLAADKELQNGITDAKARADQAYALAEAASKQANAATDEAKEAKEEVAKVAENLKVAKEGLEKQIATFSESIDAVKASLAVNKANIEKQEAAIEDLKKSDENILSKLSQSEDALNKLIVANQSKIADLEKQLAAAKEDAQKALADAKAYTDDATKLVKEELTGVKSDVNGIQLDVEALKKIGVDYEAFKKLASDDIATVKATLEALSGVDSGVITKIQNDIANINSQMSSAISDLKKDILNLGNADAQLRSDLEAKIAAVQESIKNTDLKAVEDAYKDADSKLGERIDDLNTKIANATGSVTIIQNSIIKINGELGALLSRLTNILTGMVFRPTLYYGGIPAMEVVTYEYNLIKQPTGSDAKNPSATGESYDVVSTKSYYAPDSVKGHYHLNPSSYDWKLLTANRLSAVSANCDYVPIGGQTRAINNLGVVPGNAKTDNEGGIYVNFLVDANKVQLSENKVSVVALRANVKNGEKDTLITSDYAALCKTTYKNLTIADVKAEKTSASCSAPTKEFHIYTTAREAINNEPPHELVWNDADGEDLSSYVEAHFTRNAQKNETADKNPSGLKWQFEPVHYKSGSNKTSESVHCYFEGNNIIACKASADGTAPGLEQNKSSIGRMPLVRVTLVNEKTNEIYAIGYIKFKIVKDAAKPDKPKDPIVFDSKSYTLTCGNHVDKVAWYQIEDKVLSKLNISKEDFEAQYAPEEVGNNICRLYKEDGKGGWIAASDSDPLGYVEHVVDDGAAHTNVLKWTITPNAVMKNIYVNGIYNESQQIKVAVKFTKRNSTDVIYMVFSISNVSTPEAAFSDNNKLPNYWAASNNSKTGTGFDETQINPEIVGQEGADDEIKQDILGVLVGNKISLGVSGFGGDFADAKLSYEFFFVNSANTFKGHDGKDYVTLVYDDEPTKLYAKVKGTAGKGVVIAELTGSNGKYKNNTIEYKHNDVAHTLLNYKGRNELSNEVLKAVVGFKATNSCQLPLPVNNALIPARILRPINVANDAAKGFQDGKDGGDQVNIYDIVKITDFRDFDFKKHLNYFKYYGVLNISVNTAEIQTDMTGAWKKLSDVTTRLKIEHVGGNGFANKSAIATTEAGLSQAYGALKYQNNGSVTSDFKLKVPVTVTYDWGKYTQWVEVQVKKTL